MQELPIHPALVHLPLGIAVVLPLLALGLAITLWRETLPKRVWLIVLLLSVVCLGSAIAARQTGETEEERVEEWVSRREIHKHEEAADRFVQVLAITTLACAAVFLIKKPKAFKVSLLVLTLAYVGVLLLALNVGRRGGELVFHHNAGSARAPSQ